MGAGDSGEPAGSSLTTSAVAWRLLPLFFTHINQALLTTMPFTVAVYMVRDFEAAASGGIAVSEETVGRATGMLAAVFCAAQLVTSYPWGIISDRIGRKPVMVIGNISCALSTVAFGLAGSFWQAVLARVLGGVFNAIILAEKAIIGEGLPDKDSQAKAFGLFSLCWGLGSLAGPMLGGALSAPCSAASPLRVQALCGDGSLLVHRPYFLPCLVAGILSAIATIMVMCGLEETLPDRRRLGGGHAAGKGDTLAGSGKALRYQQDYQAVPTADTPAEVELGAVVWEDSCCASMSQGQGQGQGSGGDIDVTPSSSPSTAAAAPANKQQPRPFRGDSARICRSGSPAGLRSPGTDRAADDALNLVAAGGKLDSSRSSGVGSVADVEGVAMSEDSAHTVVDIVLREQDQLLPAASKPPQQAGSSSTRKAGSGQASGAVGGRAEAVAAAAAAARDVPWFKQWAVVLSLLGYGLIAFMYNMLDEITPIFASAAVREGGLGFAPSQLAPSLSFGGLVLVAWALRGYPWLMGRMGVVRTLRLGLWHTAPLSLAIPLASLFHGAMAPTQALMMAAMGLKAIIATNAFTGCLILVNACAPVKSLGAVNGAGQSLASLVRALGPALGGLLWGWSTQLALPGWLPHQFLPFCCSAGLALGTLLVYRNFRMPDESAV